MGSFSQSSQPAYDVANQTRVDPAMSQETGKGKGRTPSNSDQVQKKLGGGSVSAPTGLKQSDLGVKSGAGFSSAASKALAAIVPGPGSFASLRIVGKVPIYSSGAMNCFLEPALALEAAHTDAGKYEVTISSQLGLLAEAGTRGSSWWPKFLAYFKGYVKGSLKIVGDSAAEIFDEFMLMIRMVVEGACDAAGAPADIKEAMSSAVMSSASKQSTIRGMDADDSATASVGGGVEAGADTSFGSAKGGAELMFSKTIENKDANPNAVEVTASKSLTIAGELEHKDMGLKVPANVTFLWKNGKLDEWYVGLSVTKRMPIGQFSDLALIGTSWAAGFVNSMANLIRNAGTKGGIQGVGPIADLVQGMSVGNDAVKYGVLGKELKKAMASPDFAGKGGAEVNLGISGQAGWSRAKGANMRLALTTSDSWTLGEEGKTPLFIEARTGDTIVSFEGSKKEGPKFGT